MKHNVLRQWHVMVGCDFHPVPCFVVQVMDNPLSLTTRKSPTILADGCQNPMVKNTDIGWMIPHVGPAPLWLLAIFTAFSASKSYFGPSSVIIKDENGAQGNPAVAVLALVNINLNCAGVGPMPVLPTGMVIAPNTVSTGLSLGDILRALLNIAIDFIIARLIDLCIGKFMNWLGPKVSRLMDRIAARFGIQDMPWRAARDFFRRAWRENRNQLKKEGVENLPSLGKFARPLYEEMQQKLAKYMARKAVAEEVAKNLAPDVLGFIVGGPYGTAIDNIGLTSPYGAFTEAISTETASTPADVAIEYFEFGGAEDIGATSGGVP